MKRLLATVVVLTVGSLAGTNSVEAGWGNISIPTKPGSYQENFIRGAYQGAKRGSEIGGNLGGAGAVIGGIQGAMFGAAHADQQHHRNKVHNYRTPQEVFPLSYWSYGAVQGGGYFQKAGNVWYEVKGGRRFATFHQMGQSRNHVLLYDPSRNMEVSLDWNGAHWRTRGGNWFFLYHRVR